MNVALLALAVAYPFVAPGTPTTPLSKRFAAPQGYTRIPATGFSAWLRDLPVRTDRAHVLAYDGARLSRPAAAVVALDVGSKDLQQCADTAYRLHAEYLYARGHAESAAYHFTSGDRSRYADWLRGERFSIRGARVERRTGAPRAPGRGPFRRWLEHLFIYAGTASLRFDTARVRGFDEARGGDVVVEPGSPGHAVILLDVAENERGHRVALLGQGFIPAEDLHVLRSAKALDGVWFPLPSEPQEGLQTPSWPTAFTARHLRRFVDP